MPDFKVTDGAGNQVAIANGFTFVDPCPPVMSAFQHALCEEDRIRIDALTAAVHRLASAIEQSALPSSEVRRG